MSHTFPPVNVRSAGAYSLIDSATEATGDHKAMLGKQVAVKRTCSTGSIPKKTSGSSKFQCMREFQRYHKWSCKLIPALSSLALGSPNPRDLRSLLTQLILNEQHDESNDEANEDSTNHYNSGVHDVRLRDCCQLGRSPQSWPCNQRASCHSSSL